MSLKVRFRGRIDDLRLVRDFEDRVLKMTSAFGSRVSLWRSPVDATGRDLIRGLVIHLSPGQSPMSLLLDQEGQLIAAHERVRPSDVHPTWSNWCTVHTAFSGVDGHAAVIELLAIMKSQWFSCLQVLDLSGYWEHRDCLLLESHLTQRVHTGFTLRRFALPGRPEAFDYPVAFEPARQAAGEFSALVEHVGRPVAPGRQLTSSYRDVSKMSFAERVREAEDLLLQNRIEEDQLLRTSTESMASGQQSDFPDSSSFADVTLDQREGSKPEDHADSLEAPVTFDTPLMPGSVTNRDGESAEFHEQSDCRHSADDDSPASSATPSLLQDEAIALSMEVLQVLKQDTGGHGFAAVLRTALLDLVGALASSEVVARGQSCDRNRICDAIVQLRQAIRAGCFAEGALSGLFAEGKISLITAARWHSRLQQIYHETQQILNRAWSRGRRAA